MEKLKYILCLVMIFIKLSVELPVTKTSTEKPKAPPVDEAKTPSDLEYQRYLNEVVAALETDEGFKQKLSQASEVDIRTGLIAHHLEFVDHKVRTELDEIKRRELERLRSLVNKKYKLTNEIDQEHKQVSTEHVDHENLHTFEIDDLKKLILKASADLTEADRKRREEFKQYELQKEFEKQEKLKEYDEENRKKYEEELAKQQQKHNKHEKIHHPGNKAQLEEVWEKQDHMDGLDFDPKAFFMMHDVDGNGYWDETEVKALFIKELDKVYQAGVPEDDMRERVEEMERMREHVFKEADVNKDNLISYKEFIDQTKRDEFQTDPGWDTIDKAPQFTHEEYLEFERRRQEEIQRLVAQGVLPPHPNMPQGYYPDGPQANYQQHPNAVPIHQQQQLHYQKQQQYDYQKQQQQNQQLHNQQMNQQQYQQPPQQQQQYQQPPQQQQYQQPPQQQQYQQPPPQPQYQQPPQQQYQPPPPPQQQQINPGQTQQQPIPPNQQQQPIPPNQQQQPIPPQQQPIPPQQQPAIPPQQQQPPPQQQQQAAPQQQQQPPPPQQPIKNSINDEVAKH